MILISYNLDLKMVLYMTRPPANKLINTEDPKKKDFIDFHILDDFIGGSFPS